jgi:hypothetical protein
MCGRRLAIKHYVGMATIAVGMQSCVRLVRAAFSTAAGLDVIATLNHVKREQIVG